VVAEREQAEKIGEIRFQSRINELQGEVEKVQLAHMVEIEKIKAEYENSIKDMKLRHEQEKNKREQERLCRSTEKSQNLEYRLDR
jgi:hypothetical protein